jgi:hypothetical protein
VTSDAADSMTVSAATTAAAVKDMRAKVFLLVAHPLRGGYSPRMEAVDAQALSQDGFANMSDSAIIPLDICKAISTLNTVPIT